MFLSLIDSRERSLEASNMTITKRTITARLLLVAILAKSYLICVDSLVLPTQQQQCRGILKQWQCPHLPNPLSRPNGISDLSSKISQKRNENRCSSAVYSSTNPSENPALSTNGVNELSGNLENDENEAAPTKTRKLERLRKSMPLIKS